jgi:hypothetical protein
MNITQDIHEFREATRHLWNVHLRQKATWDTLEIFMESICPSLFRSIVLMRSHPDGPDIPVYGASEPIHEYRVYMRGQGKLPLHVAADMPPGGRWDFPVEWIPPEENPILTPICFFDWDQLGWKRMEYYQVRIEKCPSHPEIEGRDALIQCNYVEIEITERPT